MKYKRKPLIVETVQYRIGLKHRGICDRADAPGLCNPHIHTIHDGQYVQLEEGDWIITEPDGVHFYPCKSDIFKATYEKVKE